MGAFQGVHAIYVGAVILLRATESEEQIQKRLRNARQELERAKDVSLFDHILVNAKVDTAYEQLKVAFRFLNGDYVTSVIVSHTVHNI